MTRNPQGNLQTNIERFTGFGDVYDKNRPTAPRTVLDVLLGYAGARPRLVVDIGCGTGLSTYVWKNDADRVIGVEPNADMLATAQGKMAASGATNVTFVQGYSNELEIQSGSADIVTCSQSFHWMEPDSTLRDVARVLREGGVFAAYDCDWPPTIDWVVEEAYTKLYEKADEVVARLSPPADMALKRDKEQHLANIRRSGLFRFTKEIVLHNKEACDADRFVGLMLSQGGLQTVFKLGSNELDADIASFRNAVENCFAGRTLDVLFSYRLRLGVK